MSDEHHSDALRKWADMNGRWEHASDGSVTYLGKNTDEREFGIAISDVKFSGGEIRAAFEQAAGVIDGRILLGYQSNSEEYFIIGLGGYGNAYTLTHHPSRSVGWRKIAGVGSNETLSPGRLYRLLVRLEDKRISLFVDDVCVIEHDLLTPIPYGQIGLFAWGDNDRRTFSEVSVKRIPSDIEHVVVLVHGIRTHAQWQGMLRRAFSKVGIAIAPTNYGYFDLIKFLIPIPWLRNRAVSRLWAVLQTVREDYPKAKISFLAHSFGTYVVSTLLQSHTEFDAHRIAFCGSVVRYDFPFEDIGGQFTGPLVNEVSARDPWPVIAKNLAFGYGAVGTQGFNAPQVRDRWHEGFGHSQYLTDEFCETYWIPFFDAGQIVDSPFSRDRAPRWCRLVRSITNKYILGAAVLVLILYMVL